VPLVVALCAVASAAGAQSESSPAAFELGRSMQQSLSRIQEAWLQWVGASLQDNLDRAEETLRNLSGTLREIGFTRMPDLSLAAVAQARQSVLIGDWDRAALQLDAAETLDPGNPEVRFARATLERRRGAYLRAVSELVAGVRSALGGSSGERARRSAVLWLLVVLRLSGALFVVLLAWWRGGEALAALRSLLSPPLQDGVALVLALALVLGPAALPSGLFWMLLVWSILLWSYADRSERIVLALFWLVTLATPIVADRVTREQALDQTPPMRALQSFGNGRIYGGFFADTQVLRSALPDHPAALEFVADVQRTIGQWDLARSLYRRVLLDEPQNIPVLINLGAYYFRKGDFALANAYFLRATKTPVPSAAAWFDLSLGYSDTYMFDASRDALSRAREIDASAVDVWMATPNPDRVLTFNGSLARRSEIAAALVHVWASPQAGPNGWRGQISFPAVVLLGAALLAWVFDRLRRSRLSRGAVKRRAPRTSNLEHWLHTLVPAVPAIERGSGAVAWANLLLLVVLAALPRVTDMAGDLPAANWPGRQLLSLVAVVGGALYLVQRLHAGWRRTAK